MRKKVIKNPSGVGGRAIKAFINHKPYKTEQNTESTGDCLYLHGHKIAEWRNNSLWITTAKHNTLATRGRLNQLPHVKVSVSRGDLKLNGGLWDGTWIPVDTWSSMIGHYKPNTMKKENVSMGFYDAHGFHPIRASHDYDEDRVEEHYSKKRPVRAYARKEKAFKSSRRNPIKKFHAYIEKKSGGDFHNLTVYAFNKSEALAQVKAQLKAFDKEPKNYKVTIPTANVSMGYWDGTGFHPIRASHDYDEDRVDEHYSKRRPVREYARKEKAFKAKRRNATTRKNGQPFNADKIDQLSEMFQGKVTGNTIRTLGSDLTPDLTARLGKAVLMVIKNGSTKYQLDFDDKDSFLSMDARKNLYLEGRGVMLKNIAKPNKGTLTYLGEVQQIDYITDKAHIENGETVHYYHKLGEVDGKKPNAYMDSDGFPIIIGGNYDVLPEGIAN